MLLSPLIFSGSLPFFVSKNNPITDSFLGLEVLLYHFKTNVYSILYIFLKMYNKTIKHSVDICAVIHFL